MCITEVISKLKDDLTQMHVLTEISAVIAQQNAASLKVVEKKGFIKKGLVTKENFLHKVCDYVLTM